MPPVVTAVCGSTPSGPANAASHAVITAWVARASTIGSASTSKARSDGAGAAGAVGGAAGGAAVIGPFSRLEPARIGKPSHPRAGGHARDLPPGAARRTAVGVIHASHDEDDR